MINLWEKLKEFYLMFKFTVWHENTGDNKEKRQSFVGIFGEVFCRIPENRKKQFCLLLAYMILVSSIATIAVGSIALFAAAFSSPERILDSKYIIIAQDILQMDFLRSPRGVMIFLSSLMVFWVALKNILESFLFYCVARFGAAIEAHFGYVLFKGFLHMPYEWHLNRNSADIILALQWRSYIGHSFFNTILKTVNDIFLVSFLVLAVLLANPYVSLSVFMVSGMIAYFIYNKVHHLQEKEAEKCRAYDQSINRQATKGVHGIKDVKISGKTSFLMNFKNDAYAFARIQGMRSFFERLPIGLLETIGFGALAGVIIFMLFFTNSSSMEVTAVISLLIVAAWRILPAMSRIMVGFITVRNVLPYIKVEMNYINDIESNATYPPSADNDFSDNLSFDDGIDLKDISFAYQNRDAYVLEDINFRIKKGQTVGIVGCSGVGKSTLVDIIIGLLNPSRGHVIVDGRELDMKNRYAWVKKLSYVPQSPYMCDGSIAENIAFGVDPSEIDRDFVLECCRMAYMQDVLDMLPQGINTLIGERGMRLSGGQRQRVAIARALYTMPELMIFDEATSSLDSKSERAIQNTIGALKGSKTLIIVAHRLKTVENCDFLIWLEARKIKMFDTPKNVLYEYEESLR